MLQYINVHQTCTWTLVIHTWNTVTNYPLLCTGATYSHRCICWPPPQIQYANFNFHFLLPEFYVPHTYGQVHLSSFLFVHTYVLTCEFAKAICVSAFSAYVVLAFGFWQSVFENLHLHIIYIHINPQMTNCKSDSVALVPCSYMFSHFCCVPKNVNELFLKIN